MNNSNTPQMNGIISKQVSTARKSFMFNVNAFNAKYGVEGCQTSAMLKALDSMLQTEYCEAQLADNFSGAQGVAAACRAAIYALAPWEQEFSLEQAELSRVTNFLEMSIGRELLDAKNA